MGGAALHLSSKFLDVHMQMLEVLDAKQASASTTMRSRTLRGLTQPHLLLELSLQQLCRCGCRCSRGCCRLRLGKCTFLGCHLGLQLLVLGTR
jgi:hypothetical protein